MRIVQLANMYHVRSGGLRTVVDTLGRGYAAAGHDRILIVPGAKRSVAEDEHGTVITVPGTPVTGGYRMILRAEKVLETLAALNPDSIEVSDKATLAGAGPWARERGVRAVLFSHERLGEMVANRTGAQSESLQKAVLRWTRRVVAGFDEVVATSAFGERELALAGARTIRRVPLGVDLEVFRPAGGAGSARSDFVEVTRPDVVRLVYAGRLSNEKNPQATIETVRVLRCWGVDARLDVYGSGPQCGALARRSKGLPVVFHGHVARRADLAERLTGADLVLAPSACETFGLSALEALACGVAVVAAAGSGAAELVSQTSPPGSGNARHDRWATPGAAPPGAGIAVTPTGTGLAAGVLELLTYPACVRAAAARTRASQFPWSASVERMLAIHQGALLAADVADAA
ncbi:glycosyltransferase [Actinocrinis sp.]|uniref:glycosyltransferase n=1 Tax=Actinocrinis sp. TaxID=1920516 RepID=UPI002D4E1D20|nr:glycosyltransferase [Actinocrinis sp.]HZP50101.1 glycosyltransferase [Actinocrinis sp.]